MTQNVSSLTYLECAGAIAGGFALLGVGCTLKAVECYTGRKHYIPLFSDDVATVHTRVGICAITEGVKQLTPTAVSELAVYVLGVK